VAKNTGEHLARQFTAGTLPLAAGADAMAVITAGLDYLRVREVEQTKRAYIAAKRDVLLSAITAERDLLQYYFAQRFAERRAALEHLYQALERGIHDQNDRVIDGALSGILDILKDNPLQDLETFRKRWEDPDFIVEL
jgi:hypothetical protein